ncbi:MULTISPECIES: hypothetical protein [Photorhabdus]|uniref:hypothetical protein n=1 Tax=Photorhabdus TaxID=29487 RepID=UPI000DCD0012|nr:MULTISPECIES: hypothetical protein [Photorhabdus]MDB6368655.1 hypothetical protein [Photorhabdus bodei]RAX06569.1 hypothetical protein CKY10_22200 [Photorhabdus sp. HUG-39]
MIVEVEMFPVFTGKEQFAATLTTIFRPMINLRFGHIDTGQYSLGDLTALFSVLRSTAYRIFLRKRMAQDN